MGIAGIKIKIMPEERIIHEYLSEDEYYEQQTVNKGRKVKTCEHCFESIEIGTPHDVHKFCPEFESYPTHKECSKPFKASLRTEEDNLREEKE